MNGELLGRQLGPYDIQALVGAGGMGEVYRAHDTTLHRDVALKVLPSDFALDRERVVRFKGSAGRGRAQPSERRRDLRLRGRWVAYAVNQKTFVQPFPATGAIHQLVTNGFHPTWSPNGTTLFFNPSPRSIGVVSITTTPAFAFGAATLEPRLFSMSPPERPRAYDVMPDGRFLARVPSQNAPVGRYVMPMHVVTNWFDELRAQVRADR